MAFYNAHGRTNYFLSFGEGRPVLLLHGISNSGRAWAPQIPVLVEAGYRVIVPDHAGHGASERLSRSLGVAGIADDTECLLAVLELDTLDMVGLSLGGMVALELALRHPHRFGKIIVANSFPKTTSPEFKAMAEGWASVFERRHGPIERFEQNWPSLVSTAFRHSGDGLRTYQVWHGIAATCDGASLAHVARGITDFDVTARIGNLSMPALFVAGSEDRMSTPDLSQSMARDAAQGHYAEIAGAAHISNIDSSDAFNAHMLAFLRIGNAHMSSVRTGGSG